MQTEYTPLTPEQTLRQSVDIYTTPGVLSPTMRDVLRQFWCMPRQSPSAPFEWTKAGPYESGPFRINCRSSTLASLNHKALIEERAAENGGSEYRLTGKGGAVCRGFDWTEEQSIRELPCAGALGVGGCDDVFRSSPSAPLKITRQQARRHGWRSFFEVVARRVVSCCASCSEKRIRTLADGVLREIDE